MRPFPHLTDTESVRQEAAQQYGGLNDAAAFQQAHKASLSPDVAAASLRHRNAEETAKVQQDLSLAQEKIDAVYGKDAYRVIDAAVRGDALSVVAEDQYGRPLHLVVGWTDAWRTIARSGAAAEAQANAEAEAARGRLGAEARAEVKRQVEAATAKIMAEVSSLLGKKNEEIGKIRDETLAASAEDEGDEDEGSGPVTPGSPSSTEGNDTSESGAGATQGTETGDGSGSEAKWPRTHDALDALGKKAKVSFEDLGSKPTLDEKIAKLEEAGVKPPEE